MTNITQLLNSYSTDDLKALADMITDISLEKDKSKDTIGSFYTEYIRFSEIYHSEKYRQSIKLAFSQLINFFGDELKLTELSMKKVIDFVETLKIRAPKGYRVYHRTLKAALNKALEWELIKSNPFVKVKIPKRQKIHPVFLSKNEVDVLVSNIHNLVIKYIVRFSFLTGCRLSEVVNLQYSDINFTSKLVTVGSNSFVTKTREQRIIPICDELFSILTELYNNRKSNYDNVFVKGDGFKYSPDYVSKEFKKAVRASRMSDEIHFHSLRHSFASNLVQRNVSIYTVQKLLGHSSVTTTEIYAHLNTHELVRAINNLNYN
ncbi:MAG: site-specific integrase [Ignavibacteriaceae bacterium]|jgi:integrase/recombinase XerD|nr:site-specific integrase [Ignavibacteriaceae bacterium]